MPDYFPECLSFQDTITLTTGDGEMSAKLDFPIVQANTSQKLIQELVGWEVDVTELNNGQTITSLILGASLTLNEQPAGSMIVTPTNRASSQTIGDTNVIDRFQSTTANALFGGPIYSSLIRGGLGMILPQEFVWLQLSITSDSAATACKAGVRIWYRQRSVPNRDELLGLLASRTQLDSTS